MADKKHNDDVRHGLDDNPTGDAEKGAALGGVGGAVVGGVAGAPMGPVGMIVGAVVGGIAGAAASGLGVAAVDRMDNDNTVTGIGKSDEDEVYDSEWRSDYEKNYASTKQPYDNYRHAYRFGRDLKTHPDFRDKDWNDVETYARRDWEAHNPGTWDAYSTPIRSSWERDYAMTGGERGGKAYADNPPGIQTGGRNADGSPDTRGVTEKVSDAVTGDRIDDKTRKPL